MYTTKLPKSFKTTVHTTEDWYPTQPDGNLRVAVYELVDSSDDNGFSINEIRICIWGDDDFGMDKDRSVDDITFDQAVEEAKLLPSPITVKWLEENGYVRA